MKNNLELYKLLNEHNLEFNTYYNALIEFNQKVNLTAITEKNEVYVKHFLDSILPIDEMNKNANLVDIGSGAGFPGLPIKIVRPDVNLTMVDSLNKRVKFLNEVLNKLKIDANAVHARAEDFCLNNREKFDIAAARAVAKLNTLLEYLLPLVKVGGYVFAYKGSNYAEELNESQKAIEVLGGKVEKILTFNLPSNLNLEGDVSLGQRNIIIIKKIKPTPKQFPRGQNKPKTDPIC